jgi:S-adenosylmethionine:tRNA ribosyltransferase-isomerase
MLLLQDFYFDLPYNLIAQHPPTNRGDSRLLTLDGASGQLGDREFGELPELLRPGDLIIFNDTRVVPARLYGSKVSGGRIELLVERLLDEERALIKIRTSHPPKLDSLLILDAGFTANVIARHDDFFEIRANSEQPLLSILEKHGLIPLPPYITRMPNTQDTDRYQTVYARQLGAVAAPTAGLHFNCALLDRINAMGVESAFITLHIGSGTFQPVRVKSVVEHSMHSEFFEVKPEVCEKIRSVRQHGGRMIAVGTTVARALETASDSLGIPHPFHGETKIFIYPGYQFRCVDALITNFHLPESTLLMLAAAFVGRKALLNAYRHAIENRYRFFTYGDAMFLTRTLNLS